MPVTPEAVSSGYFHDSRSRSCEATSSPSYQSPLKVAVRLPRHSAAVNSPAVVLGDPGGGQRLGARGHRAGAAAAVAVPQPDPRVARQQGAQVVGVVDQHGVGGGEAGVVECLPGGPLVLHAEVVPGVGQQGGGGQPSPRPGEREQFTAGVGRVDEVDTLVRHDAVDPLDQLALLAPAEEVPSLGLGGVEVLDAGVESDHPVAAGQGERADEVQAGAVARGDDQHGPRLRGRGHRAVRTSRGGS